ncbi:MAG: radical SAM protein, partial [Alphaproteobacteria bacterium]|nr:radical SAM protein [Alphaproteobacteria bacterium]
MSPLGPKYGFGLYVHWPYCSRVCPYCDFNVYAAKARETAPLVAAICADIQAHRALLPEHPALSSIFLGGGTPSLLSAPDMAAILKAADEAFGLAPGAEITLEANPNDLSHARLADWAACGVNRLSIGVQSLNDDALVFLGREHDSATARRAIEAGAQQFDNHSIDLIYALPGQSLDQWRTELSNVLAMGAPHLSLYELTIAERTAFWH